MKKNKGLFFALLIFTACNTATETKEDKPKNSSEKTISENNPKLEKSVNDSVFTSGDIIFQTSLSNQSDLITLATQSPFTHCGLIIQSDTNLFVLEANGKVKSTPLSQWIKNGKDGKYVVMRFKEIDNFNNKDNVERAQKLMKKFMGKPYDYRFFWSDDDIYCSELVWKFYYETIGIELCPTRKLGDFDLTSEKVKAELVKRYANNVPLNETIVAPSDIAASNQLEMIYSNY